MRFKQWLLLEGGFNDSGSDWFYGSSLLPSDAGDWPYAHPHPADFILLQSRWDLERGEGRKFYNLDLDKVLATKITSVYSQTMPDTSPGGWKHKEDYRDNLRVDTNAKLELQGYRGQAQAINKLTISNNLLDMKDKLNKLFGEFTPKYPTLSKDFDEPWVHNENNMNPYQLFGPTGRNFVNKDMGIPSRLLGPDETGEKEEKKHVKTADFGFGRRKRRWKKINTIS